MRSLAALAPFAAEGLIADVVVADLGSRDATLAVADAAGCTIVENCAETAAALERSRQARAQGMAPLPRARRHARARGRDEACAITSRETRRRRCARLSRSSAGRRSMAACRAWSGLRCVGPLAPARNPSCSSRGATRSSLRAGRAAGAARDRARASKGRSKPRLASLEAISRPCAANARRGAA